jgi:WD40 repeat protein
MHGHTDQVSSAAFSIDDKQLVTASRDGTAKIWDTTAGDLKSILKLDAGVHAASFSPDGTVVTVDEHSAIKTWDAAKATLLFEWEKPVSEVVGVAFSPNGKWLATTDRDGKTEILDVATRGTVLHHWKILNGIAEWNSFSPDSDWVVSTDWQATATIWQAATGKKRAVLGPVQDWPTLRGAINPDGTLVATAGFKSQVWDGMTGSPLVTLSSNLAYAAAFNKDGTRLVTGGVNGARIWQMTLENRPPADIARLIHCRVPLVLNGEGLMPVSLDDIDADCSLHHEGLDAKKD